MSIASNTFEKEITERYSENISGFTIVETYIFWKNEALSEGALISTVMTHADIAAFNATLPSMGDNFVRLVDSRQAIVISLSGGHIKGEPNKHRFTVTYEYKTPGAFSFSPDRTTTTKIISLSMEALNESSPVEYATPNGEAIPVDISRYATVITESWDDTNYSSLDYEKVGKVDILDASKLYRDYQASPQTDESGTYYNITQSHIIHPDGSWDKDFKVKGHVVLEGGVKVTQETPVYIKADGTQGLDDGSDAAIITVEIPRTGS